MTDNPDLNPTPEARIAMILWNREYAEGGLGSMGFWTSRTKSQKAIFQDFAAPSPRNRRDSVTHEDDDPTCTDCGGTGETYQTERRCSCQRALSTEPGEAVTKPADGMLDAAALDAAMSIAFDKFGIITTGLPEIIRAYLATLTKSSPIDAVDGEMVRALRECLAYIQTPMIMLRDEEEKDRRTAIVGRAIVALSHAQAALEATPVVGPLAFIVEKLDGTKRTVMLAEKYDPRKTSFWVDEEAQRNHRVIALVATPPAPTSAVDGAEAHEFTADPHRASKCFKCGRHYDARIHDFALSKAQALSATLAVPGRAVAWQTRLKPTGAKHWGEWHSGKMTAIRDGWDVEERRLYTHPLPKAPIDAGVVETALVAKAQKDGFLSVEDIRAVFEAAK